MKVAAHNDGTELRGSEKQLLMIVRGLIARGHGITVSCRSGSPTETALCAYGIRSTRIRPHGDLDLYHAARFYRWLTTEAPDALLLTSWKRIFIAVAAARRAHVPRIIVRLGIVRRMPASGSRHLRYRSAFDHVDALVVNSRDVADAWLETATWFDSSRLHIVPNAVEPVTAAPLDRRTLGIPAGARLLVTVAGLEKRKGIGTLLDALPRLPAIVHAAIAGDGPERDALQTQAAALGVHNRVHWLGHRTDVPALLATANAFVLPSRQDSIANSVLEAMMAGLPVVATEGTGVTAALSAADARGPAGWVVPVDNADALAHAIAEALSSDAVARGDEARRRAKEWYGVDRMVARYETILRGTPGAPA